jgi:predicted SPOUT superfamily RNA methylase MTH1
MINVGQACVLFNVQYVLILYSTRFDSRGRQRLTAAAACLAHAPTPCYL